MASPNTGLFASSFIDGFLKQQQSQKDRLNKNKIIKLQTKLIEQQLLAGTIKADATTTLMEALAGRPAIDTPGDIGPDEFGPPKSLSGREPLGLAGIIAELRDNPEFLSAAIGSGQLDLGDFIGKQQQPTSFTREATDAGILPGTPEFKEAFLAKNKADEQSQVLAELMASMRLEQVEKATGERQDKERERAQGLVRGRIAIRNHFSLVNEAIAMMRDLQKTALQSGIPGGDQFRDVAAIVGAVQEFFGKESPQAKVITDKRDRLKKLLAVTMAQSLESMRGTMSVVRINSMLASLPTLENSDVANAQLFSDQMQSLLDEGDIQGFAVGGREFIEAFIADPLAGLTQAKESVQSFDGPAFIDSATGKARSAFDTASGKARAGFDAATVFAQDAGTKLQTKGSVAADFAQRKINEFQQIDFSGLSQETQAAVLNKLDEATGLARVGLETAQPTIDAAVERVKSGLATVADIAKLTLEDIKQIDKKAIADWTAEQKAALDKRLKELGF